MASIEALAAQRPATLPRRDRIAFWCCIIALLVETLAIFFLLDIGLDDWLLLVVLSAPALGLVGFARGLSGLYQGTTERFEALRTTILGACALSGPWVIGMLFWF
ncbi:MAG: hypothetical protein EXS08_01020 [Planctomycetes bacterium]|nr:hypothetical protein [Planctomycetota bacterium]